MSNENESKAIATTGRTSVVAWQPLQFSAERLAIIRKTIAPASATPAEVDFFVEWAQQTGLNPFLKQCYLIERWDGQTNTKKHDPMVAEAGFAARADSMADFRGMRSGVVYEGDEFSVDEVAGVVVHRWDAETRSKLKDKTPLGAWAQGFRDGRTCEITWLTFDSRAQKKKADQQGKQALTKFWATDGAGQIRKCARADQYRRLYPNLFAGWYEPAEFNDDVEGEVINSTSTPAPVNPTGKTDALEERLRKNREAKKANEPASAPVPAPKASPPKEAPNTRSSSGVGITLPDGSRQWIELATLEQLEVASKKASEAVLAEKDPKKKAEMVRRATAIEAEIGKRGPPPDTEPAPQPVEHTTPPADVYRFDPAGPVPPGFDDEPTRQPGEEG